MFQILTFASIVAGIINYMKATTQKITDFNVGSVARTLIEAPAVEIDQLYQEMFSGLQDAIPTATYNSFNFGLLPAVNASGRVTVDITAQASDVLIPAGTVLSFSGGATTYTSLADTTITASDTNAQITIAAVAAGALGNIPANTSFSLTPQPAGFVSATNAAAFTNGADPETEPQRKVRFQDYISALQHGTIAAIIFGLKQVALTVNGIQTEKVASAALIEPYVADNSQPVALINAYIHNGVGATSSDLIAAAQQAVDGYNDASGNPVPGWKAAGVICTVYAATEMALNISGALSAGAGFLLSDLDSSAAAVANNYLLGIGIGQTFEVAKLVALVMAIPGVLNMSLAPLAPPAAPTLGSSAAGALAGATYYTKVTYVNSKGETLASAEANLVVAANHVLTVTSPPAITGATGWNVYVGTSAGAEERQNAATIAIGTDYTEPTSGLVAGVAPPTINTAQLADVSVTGSQKIMPGTVTFA